MTTREKILITGASSGLGEGMAREFAKRGRSLGLCARRLDRLTALAAELRPDAAQIEVAELDVTDFDSIPGVFGALRDQLGGLDRVIVNAGLGKGAPIGTGKARANLETVQTNLTGALAQAEAALEIFREQGAGHLVLISSVSANRGLPKAQAAYAASKAGVTALGQGLQAEFAGKPIQITVIEPGYIETDINRGVKTRLMAKTEDGVAAMVAAIEAEKAHAAVPRWPWEPLAAAMRYLPEPVSRRMV
ncbi:SDR family oxidoreductase [Gordonia crocea]|uniref:Putative short-chain dehydrogenase/reductase n=1 Tax=Gordonia crocea TaxID=589162 RepID=A0A7I9UVZ5_9ACTN|nr:SDR family oxidoreductase [Gordonia crocea]GED96950.1 putative short-chain dehydrogenase/reductase [Gordonia crocea]